MSLSKITKNLGEAYREWKATEKEKDDYRDQFFKAIDFEKGGEELMTEVVTLFGPTEGEARVRATEHHSAWKTTAVKDVGDGYFEFVLEELPQFAPHTFVNPEDGMVYSRRVSAGPLNFDDELLKQRDPELYERVTYLPEERQLKQLDEISGEDMAALADYLYEGKPQIKLAPPRKAKPEELENE